MSLLDSLFHPRILLAILAFAAASTAVGLAEIRLHPVYSPHAATAWITEYVLIPLAEVITILVFILVAYPALYGLPTAPGILTLLGRGEMRTADLVNSLFLLSLILPLIPLFNRLPGFVRLAQAMTATAMIFYWLAARHELTFSLLPGPVTLVLIVVWSWLAQRLVYRIAHQREGDRLTARVLYWHLISALQLPSILLYAHDLGGRL